MERKGTLTNGDRCTCTTKERENERKRETGRNSTWMTMKVTKNGCDAKLYELKIEQKRRKKSARQQRSNVEKMNEKYPPARAIA